MAVIVWLISDVDAAYEAIAVQNVTSDNSADRCSTSATP